MIRSRMAFVLLLLLLFAADMAEAAQRRWTDSTGRYSVEGTFVRMHEGKVDIRRADGKLIRIGFDRLSADDQQYVRHAATSPDTPSPFAPLDPRQADQRRGPTQHGEHGDGDRSMLPSDPRQLPEPGGWFDAEPALARHRRESPGPAPIGQALASDLGSAIGAAASLDSVGAAHSRFEFSAIGASVPPPGGGYHERLRIDPSVNLWGGGIDTPAPGGAFQSAITPSRHGRDGSRSPSHR